jgi:predicted AAA+ superfamily ATPase
MASQQDVLARIADALERLAPQAPAPTDWLSAPAYFWRGDTVLPVGDIPALPLGNLRGIDQQKAAVCANLERLATGAAAHDMLLWGARGMGKSALIRSAVNAVQAGAAGKLGLVQIAPDALLHFPALIAALSKQDRAFLLFVDDLGFGADSAQENLALRSLLDGGIVARPGNIRIAVTSNRRAIVQREADEADAVHERDERDNALALADRFGLTLGFHPCGRETYLEIVASYAEPLGLEVDAEEALAFAIARGNRSGRTAYQFACELAGRAGLTL